MHSALLAALGCNYATSHACHLGYPMCRPVVACKTMFDYDCFSQFSVRLSRNLSATTGTCKAWQLQHERLKLGCGLLIGCHGWMSAGLDLNSLVLLHCREQERLGSQIWGQVCRGCSCAHPDCPRLFHWYANRRSFRVASCCSQAYASFQWVPPIKCFCCAEHMGCH